MSYAGDRNINLNQINRHLLTSNIISWTSSQCAQLSRIVSPHLMPEVDLASEMSYILNIYSETSIYRSRIIRFLSESYLNYGSRIYCFPGAIVSFSDPQQKLTEVSLY
jgi:hypothetical protein